MPDAMTDEWIPCEPKPTDEKANHWPHFRPLDAALGDKWYISAFKHAITNYDTSLLPTSDFSVEYMGPHIQNCKTDPLVCDTFIPHGCVEVRMPAGERNFDGFRDFFANHPIGTAIEGVVAYCADGSYRKIRRDMFRDKDDKRLQWPNGDGLGIAQKVYDMLLMKDGVEKK